MGPIASGQERTLDIVRKLVQVLRVDEEPVRELRWAVLERVVQANAQELRHVAGCLTPGADRSDSEEAKPRPE